MKIIYLNPSREGGTFGFCEGKTTPPFGCPHGDPPFGTREGARREGRFTANRLKLLNSVRLIKKKSFK